MWWLSPVSFTVNGERRDITVEPRKLLADALREDCGLTGTHLGCEHGVCGACTVLLDGDAVRSCLVFAVQADGAEVTTVEGLAADGQLNPVQEAFRAEHGLQCGFCTPGFVVSATALLARTPDPSEQQIREGLSGNLCRCTGYQGILRAVRRAAARWGRGDEHHRQRRGSSANPCTARRTAACSPATASTWTTSRCPACSTPRSCAASSPRPRSPASTRRRPTGFRASWRC